MKKMYYCWHQILKIFEKLHYLKFRSGGYLSNTSMILLFKMIIIIIHTSDFIIF